MRKEFLFQCPEIITQQAEPLRTAGKLKEAIALVEPARVELKSIQELTDRELSDLMRAWRIDVVANTSASKRSMTGEKAVRHLKEARNVITTYYNHPHIQEKAPQIKKDNEGHPYDFAVEMLRDKARYCLAAATITGDNSFRLAAIKFFEEAIDAVNNNDLVGMEAGIVENDFEQIAENYHVARSDDWEFLSNPDRARWMARTYFGESVKRLKFVDSLTALSDLVKIRKNPVKLIMDGGIGILRSLPIHRLQRATLPKNFNPEDLKLT